MYRWFSKESHILPNLPHTRIYESPRDVYDMMHEHGVVYIKPIWGMKGFGVVRACFENGNAVFMYRKDEENEAISAADKNEADSVLERLFKKGGHIIQQGLDLISCNGGVVDFRCVMQKDETRNWVCNGIVARTGAKGSVVSNISSGGAAMPAMELIKDALSLSDKEIFTIRESMVSLCMKVCGALDDYGLNYGSLGLDLGVDKKGHIWLIEVNNRRPHPAIALRANEVQSYYKILASPLYYAKALAGFGYSEEV
jgi:glutathione synthase/RimK-type ligase-like ATP-grasp enzyme